MEKTDIRSLDVDQWREEIEKMGEKSFRAGQIFEWAHKKQVESFEEMTNVSKTLREKLKEKYAWFPLKEIFVMKSQIDETKKYVWELADGHFIESVWMKHHYGNSVCISSQVGCRMGCTFCASTLDGLGRSLTASEMLGQVYTMAKRNGERVSNVVVMGMGEPLDNYNELVQFIRLLSHEKGSHLSQRNITVSTCGIVPKIYELAEEGFQITLAISLHAPNDEKRKRIMPIGEKYSIEELLLACNYYFKKTGRRLTFEYSLIEGFNDRQEDASQLSELLKDLCCHVNLIPVNPIKEGGFVESRRKDILNFQNNLEKNGINVTIRREIGRDIQASCGQLRRYVNQGPMHKERERNDDPC